RQRGISSPSLALRACVQADKPEAPARDFFPLACASGLCPGGQARSASEGFLPPRLRFGLVSRRTSPKRQRGDSAPSLALRACVRAASGVRRVLLNWFPRLPPSRV